MLFTPAPTSSSARTQGGRQQLPWLTLDVRRQHKPLLLADLQQGRASSKASMLACWVIQASKLRATPRQHATLPGLPSICTAPVLKRYFPVPLLAHSRLQPHLAWCGHSSLLQPVLCNDLRPLLRGAGRGGHSRGQNSAVSGYRAVKSQGRRTKPQNCSHACLMPPGQQCLSAAAHSLHPTATDPLQPPTLFSVRRWMARSSL